MTKNKGPPFGKEFFQQQEKADGVKSVGALLLRQCLHRVIMFGRHMVVIVFIYHPLTEMFIYHPRLILFTALTPHRSAIFIRIYFLEMSPKSQFFSD